MTVTINIRTLFGFAAGFVVAAIMFFAFQAVTADAVGSDEATFVPITPCRLFDTRAGDFNVGPRDIPIGEDSPVSFQVTGTNGDCTIPASATAVSINLTGVSPTTATNVRLYPADAAVPNASVLNMIAGQTPAPNKLDVKLSPDGKVAIYNRFGSIHVIGDVMGYYRHDGIADLEARIAELETLTASMSTVKVDGQPTVRFKGVNVQIVSGSGSTDGKLNGRGNLIVGYGEKLAGDARNGSHNLIVGNHHSYSSFGSFLAGTFNTASAPFTTVSGGAGNTAGGEYSSVSGGNSNTASGNSASVSGGFNNKAVEEFATVVGGFDNTASGNSAVVAGGTSSTASGKAATVSGGNSNIADGDGASVSGGSSNAASGFVSSIAGGSSNTASGDGASVSGGSSNTASSADDTVAGGDNVICSSGSNDVVCGEGTITVAD